MEARKARERLASQRGHIDVRLFDRTDPATMHAALGVEGDGPITCALVLPAHGPDRFRGPLSEAGDDDIAAIPADNNSSGAGRRHAIQ